MKTTAGYDSIPTNDNNDTASAAAAVDAEVAAVNHRTVVSLNDRRRTRILQISLVCLVVVTIALFALEAHKNGTHPSNGNKDNSNLMMSSSMNHQSIVGYDNPKLAPETLEIDWKALVKSATASGSSSSSIIRNNANNLKATAATNANAADTSNAIPSSFFPMPSGVNLGSWLALEDYFFAGVGGTEVATPDDATAAICLPPLHTGGDGPSWQSETDLLSSLIQSTGSLAKALRVFHAHRTSFIDFEDDLALLDSLGIHNVRVPMSWCFTDADPSTIDITVEHDETVLRQQFTCQDPFYTDTYWPAIPKQLIVDFLKACAQHNIRAVLDIHTYPGATSIGTFSGLWPKWPKFWTDGDFPENLKKDVGRKIFQDFVAFLESLDEEALAGLRGVSSMNEPAHLAGLFGPGGAAMPWKDSFLPDLPTQLAQHFLEELNADLTENPNLTRIHDGPHLRVLMWLRDSVETFRQSKLPSLGKEIHINIHESLFRPIATPKPGDEPSAIQMIASWWRAITLPNERESWAILDIHHYHAWDAPCQGASDGIVSGSNYTCNDATARHATLERCAAWVPHVFRRSVDLECGAGAKLASAEFSASTHHLVRHACNDVGTLRESYLSQLYAAQMANVELFWWSFKMPYGGPFRSAWSFKHFLYRLGVLTQPDDPIYDCGQHVPRANEPKEPVMTNDNKK